MSNKQLHGGNALTSSRSTLLENVNDNAIYAEKEYMADIQRSLGKIESDLLHLNTSLEKLEDKVDTSLAKLEDKVDTSFTKLEDKVDKNFHIVWTGIIALAIGMAGFVWKINADTNSRIDAVNKDLSAKIDTVNKDLSSKIDTVNTDLSTKMDNNLKTILEKIDNKK